jgi:hypothetical protein
MPIVEVFWKKFGSRNADCGSAFRWFYFRIPQLINDPAK